MTSNHADREVKRLQNDLDRLIKRYSNCSDPEAIKIVRKLKKIRKKTDPSDNLGTAMKITWVIDRIRELIDQLPPMN